MLEFLERLHLAAKPFTAVLLRCVRQQYLQNQLNKDHAREWRGQKKLPYGSHHISSNTGSGGSLLLQFMQQAKDQMSARQKAMRSTLRVGHGRDNNDIIQMLASAISNSMKGSSFKGSSAKGSSSFKGFSQPKIAFGFGSAKTKSHKRKVAPVAAPPPVKHVDPPPSNDPAARTAFSLRFDAAAQLIQDMEVHVEHIYESRIAALERYVAFCVLFHAMAVHTNKPWLLFPWDTARSQSNLRVATTG